MNPWGRKGKKIKKVLMMKHEFVDESVKVNVVHGCSSGGWQW